LTTTNDNSQFGHIILVKLSHLLW